VVLCLCEAVTDRKVRDVVRCGAGTVGAIARATKAGTGCGSCVCDLKRILDEERKAEREAAEELPMAAK
jgi:bacterioferritin-associated ferredoxin